MDIKPPLNTGSFLASPKVSGDGLNLKMHQLLEAKVIETQAILDRLTLKVADKTLTLQADRPLNLQSGQNIQLLVVKLLPQPEFKVLPHPLPQIASSTTNLAQDTPVLKWIAPTQSPTASTQTQLSSLLPGLQLQASIVDIANNKITLQLLPQAPSSATQQLPANALIMLDPKQLIPANTSTDATAQLKTMASPANTLTVGTQLTLQVVKAGDSPTFAILTASANEQQIIMNAFKQLLPLQASPAVFLNHLQQALPQLLTDASLAEALKNVAQKILSSLPITPQLTEATQLKQAIDESGLFFESKLAELLLGKPDISLQDDFKFKLNKLIQLINQELANQAEFKSSTTGELLKESLQKAHGTLAKLTLDQLNSLPKDESPKLNWTLELPFFHDDKAENVTIQIERDQSQAHDNTQNNWAVSITLTPPDLATIHCRISCYDGAINTRFWSDAAETVDKINAHLDYLKQQFEQKGLTTGFMEAHQGQPPQADSITMPKHLLSEKA